MAMDGWNSTSNDTRVFISRSLVGLYLPCTSFLVLSASAKTPRRRLSPFALNVTYLLATAATQTDRNFRLSLVYNVESCTTVCHRTQSTTTYVKDTLQNTFAERTKIAFSSPPYLGCEPLQHGPVCRKESTGQLRHPQVLFSVPAVE